MVSLSTSKCGNNRKRLPQSSGALARSVVVAELHGFIGVRVVNEENLENFDILAGVIAAFLRHNGAMSMPAVGRQCDCVSMSQRDAQRQHELAVKHTSIERIIVLIEWRLDGQSKGSRKELGERGKPPTSNLMRIVSPRY